MRNFRLILFVFIFLSFFSCTNNSKKEYSEEDIQTVKPLTDAHIDFIVGFYPNVVEANQEITKLRDQILGYRDNYSDVIGSRRKRNKLNDIADQYRLTDSLFRKNMTADDFSACIEKLLNRVDIIPEKLVMAQAIIESGWGSSKYAKSINNYFGIHCYTPGCGEPPSAVKNPKFWVKSFASIEDCVEEYIWNLNIGHAYKDLRKTRLKLHKENNFPDALEMAKGLGRYSEKGSEYITLVNSIIKNYLPPNLDAFVDYHQNKSAS
jgi:Bax protein